MGRLVFKVTDVFETDDSLWITTDKLGSNGHLGDMVIELKTPQGKIIKVNSRVLHVNRGLDDKDHNYSISVDRFDINNQPVSKNDVPIDTEIWIPDSDCSQYA